MQKLQRSKSTQVWRCQKCFFDNSIFLQNCQICEAKVPQKIKINQKNQIKLSIKEKQQKTQKKQILTCLDQKCKTQNGINQIKCKKCGKFLIKQLNQQDQNQQKSIKMSEQKVQLVICSKCNFQNDSQNTHCVKCDIKLPRKKVPRKPKVRAPLRKGPNYCEKCNTYKAFIGGLYGTQMQCQCPQPNDGKQIQKNICNYCFTNLKSGEYEQHIQNCKQKQIFYDHNKNKSYDRCTKLQIQTMIYMHKKCQKLHFSFQKTFIARIQKLGYNMNDLQNLYHYIVNYAPIIIHMHADSHMQFFVKDTHYRSQFETSKSSGSLSKTARIGWQNRMFDNKHHYATDYQRVKYGTMNFTNDPHGVSACTSYGQSYFLLKQHVRDRCTMTDMDSSSASSTICTFRFCYHLLRKLSDAQIKAAFEGSKAKQIKSMGVINMYKQIQIHGPVQFKKDIQKVYIHKAELAKNVQAQTLIKEFCKKNDLEFEIFGEVPKPIPPLGFSSSFSGSFGTGIGAHGSSFYPGTGSMFGSSIGPGFSFGGSVFPSSGMFGHPLPTHIKPPIKYTSVSFPYSSKTAKKQKDQQDYI